MTAAEMIEKLKGAEPGAEVKVDEDGDLMAGGLTIASADELEGEEADGEDGDKEEE